MICSRMAGPACLCKVPAELIGHWRTYVRELEAAG